MARRAQARTMASAPPDIFDRRRRAARRARVGDAAEAFLPATMRTMLIDRLGDVTRSFTDILLLGGQDSALAHELAAGGRLTIIEPATAMGSQARVDTIAADVVCADEDRLPVEPASFDLIVWPGGLDSVNDVPGALLRCRFALKPDGLLLGCFIGDASLPTLRHCFTETNAPRIVQRMHPQIEVRAMGDLVSRAGLTMPVVDVERLSVRYASLDRLIGDVRDAALSNVLAGTPPMNRAERQAAFGRFETLRDDDGRVTEQVNIIHFSGWAPDDSQPRPARRGSATVSLADALRPASPEPSATSPR